MHNLSFLLRKIDLYAILAGSALISLSYKLYGPFTRSNDGRKIVIIKNDDGTSKTISYPKHLMQQYLGRELTCDETVHHKDGNHDNNDLNNLELIPRSEHSANDTRRVKKVKFHCAWCNKEFERSPRLVRDKAKKGKVGPFCDRTCAGKYSRHLQLKLIDKFDVQPMIDSEYYTIRDKKASFIPNIIDIFIDNYCDVWEE